MAGAEDDFRGTVEQCILMEIQAMTLYTTLANRVVDPEAARVLRYLAEEEEGHVGRVAEIFSALGERAGDALSRVDVVKAYRDEAWSRHKARLAGAGLSDASPADDFLAFALAAEAHARTRYERLAGEAPDPKTEAVFRALASEEAGHEENLKRIRRLLGGRG
ncbi:MAG: ferritin-like domain-containing protein [Gemmatimonadota bacterium]